MRPFDWDDLRIFLAFTRAETLAQCAQRLKVDSSTISRRLAHLESALGHRLFERTRAGSELTKAGRQVLQHAEQAEGAIIGIDSDLGEESHVKRLVRLIAPEGIGSLYLASRLSLLSANSPNLLLELITVPIVTHIDRRETDLSLTPFKLDGQGVVSEKIASTFTYIYGAPPYLDRKGMPGTIEELRQCDFVGYNEDLIQDGSQKISQLQSVAIGESNIVFRSNSIVALLNAASAGIGLIELPKYIARGTNLMPILPDVVRLEREIWINVSRDFQFTDRVKLVVSFLKKLIESDTAAGLI